MPPLVVIRSSRAKWRNNYLLAADNLWKGTKRWERKHLFKCAADIVHYKYVTLQSTIRAISPAAKCVSATVSVKSHFKYSLLPGLDRVFLLLCYENDKFQSVVPLLIILGACRVGRFSPNKPTSSWLVYIKLLVVLIKYNYVSISAARATRCARLFRFSQPMSNHSASNFWAINTHWNCLTKVFASLSHFIGYLELGVGHGPLRFPQGMLSQIHALVADLKTLSLEFFISLGSLLNSLAAK